jgi:hypothetical protein
VPSKSIRHHKTRTEPKEIEEKHMTTVKAQKNNGASFLFKTRLDKGDQCTPQEHIRTVLSFLFSFFLLKRIDPVNTTDPIEESNQENQEPAEATGEAEPKPLEKPSWDGKIDRNNEANPDSMVAVLEEVGRGGDEAWRSGGGELWPGSGGARLDAAPAQEKQNSRGRWTLPLLQTWAPWPGTCAWRKR